jgi:hypothetical protein
MSGKGVSESEFFMWRGIFALAHADHVVTREEQRFMYRILEKGKFSAQQREILENDMKIPQDSMAMFLKIKEHSHRSRFFYFARMLMWADGDFGEQEQRIMTELGKAHHKTVDFSRIGDMGLQLEDDQKQWIEEDMALSNSNPLSNFMKRFIKG